MFLSNSIDTLPHTSIQTIRRLKSIGVNTYRDLLNYVPFRYKNYSIIAKIDSIQPGEIVTVIGTITDCRYQIARTGLRIQKFTLEDETGAMDLVWYNQPYLLTLLKKGSHISVAGEIEKYGRKLLMSPKEYEVLSFDDANHRNELLHTGRIIPVYPETRGLSSKTIREKIRYLLSRLEDGRQKDAQSEAVDKIHEIYPDTIISGYRLIGEYEAYRSIHFPPDIGALERATRRLAFDELFMIQLSSYYIRKEWEQETVTHPFRMDELQEDQLRRFIDHLPFRLTKAQVRVIGEIREDLGRKRPMNRFLQGEVGSGKTVVAAIACYISFLNGCQSVIMAPTEILAQQHHRTITELFRTSQISNSKLKTPDKVPITDKKSPNIILLTGSVKPGTKELDTADIIIGTHAVIQKKINFRNAGFVVIDEQHRFGVAQRAELKYKGINPHVLSMTATPIPRTVMLTLYQDLDMSVIDEMPAGRIPVKTYYVQKEKRTACYQWIMRQISTYHTQAFIICPLIEESDTESMKSVKAVTREFEYLQTKIFPSLRLGLVHGRLKAQDKNAVMTMFKDHELDILVATPVVEVGVDIPNASIMIIEGAERFGLAQLHQLRGRIGRGNQQSYCYVFSEQASDAIRQRLEYFAKTANGSELAQKDLEIRGPGTLYGTMQHGFADLKIASFSNFDLIEQTKRAVHTFTGSYQLEDYQALQKRLDLYRTRLIARN